MCVLLQRASTRRAEKVRRGGKLELQDLMNYVLREERSGEVKERAMQLVEPRRCTVEEKKKEGELLASSYLLAPASGLRPAPGEHRRIGVEGFRLVGGAIQDAENAVEGLGLLAERPAPIGAVGAKD